jgi:large subunit ribosomal protein L25
MKRVEIEAAVREGRVTAKKMKKDGKVPAVVYGKETKSMPIEIKIKDIEKTVKTLAEGTLLITLKLKDKGAESERTVVIQEVQRDPRTEEIIHADFHQISESEKAMFHVPIFTTGLAEGVKIGGVLEFITREVVIRCLPKDLPLKFEVDTTPLKIGNDLKVADLKLPEGAELMTAKEKVICSVVSHKVEEAPKPADAAAAAAATAESAQPELIKKERAGDEEGEEGAAPAKGGAAPAKGAAAPAKEEKKDSKKK